MLSPPRPCPPLSGQHLRLPVRPTVVAATAARFMLPPPRPPPPLSGPRRHFPICPTVAVATTVGSTPLTPRLSGHRRCTGVRRRLRHHHHRPKSSSLLLLLCHWVHATSSSAAVSTPCHLPDHLLHRRVHFATSFTTMST
jgi:hypothetical protein